MWLRSTRVAFLRRAIKLTKSPTLVRQYQPHSSIAATAANQTPQPNDDLGSSFTKIVEYAADLLPNQGILENFVHHNPLEHFQSMNFIEALEHVHKLESYMSPGERAFSLLHIDPRKRANEALVDLCSSFLDRGAAKWAPKFRDQGFLYFFSTLETLGFAPWRKYARQQARLVRDRLAKGESSLNIAGEILQEHLEFFGIPRDDWHQAIRSMLLELRGWAGMFRRMETHPEEAPDKATVRLIEFCAVQCIFYRSSIVPLAKATKWDDADPFKDWLNRATTYREDSHEVPTHPSAIAFENQSIGKREAMETEYMNALLHAIGTQPVESEKPITPSLQLYTCIDDRECSLRRHVEESNPKSIETFGVAGFFGIPIRFQSLDRTDEMILAPEGQRPTAVMVEEEWKEDHQITLTFNRRRKLLCRLSGMWENFSFSPLGSLFLTAFFPLSMARLLLMGFSPSLKYRIKDRFLNMVLPKPHTDFQPPFLPEQAAAMLARTFKDLGTHNRFAPIVVILGHGSISVNNPFAAAYNCGACGGRHGGPNARLFARLANDPQVRKHLLQDHNIDIPDSTIFIGGLHNTTAETVEFFDVETLPATVNSQFLIIQQILAHALGLNALERCHRFLLAKNVRTPEEALLHVQNRANDAAEVRPELNHATNAAVVIGRRDLTKGRFLDRRVFLPSYDPTVDDDQGTNLEHVLAPALVVCSGINLEYLFSTVDVDHHGAGTKAPLNIVGNIGVLQGTSGDLRPGLPSQMTEMHTPVRALFIIDAPSDRVEAVLARRKDLRELVRNEWVRLIVRDPSTGQFYRQSNGQYIPIAIKQEAPDFVPFTPHLTYAQQVAKREDFFYRAAASCTIAACGLPIYAFGMESMYPHGPLIAICGTMLSLPVLAFARRYLHGEFMFGRFSVLCVGLVLGFNLVATAPTLEIALGGWSLFGFASTFLIGAYNERPTVRNNAIFAFAAYAISDFALLLAATFHELNGHENQSIVAAGLLLAAIFKSSQFPLTSLFVRSMEGPTPASALGYAGLSAHFGVVLLAITEQMWFSFDWARIALGAIGTITAVYGSLTSKIRADRKGAIAKATSASLGLIFVTLALGYPNLALVMSLGHAAYRMIQILRAPNFIGDSQKLQNVLGSLQTVVPNWLYRFCWMLHRFHSDFHLLNVLNILSRPLNKFKPLDLSKMQQWLMTGLCVVVAGAPYTPFSHYLEEFLRELLPTHPVLAGAVMIGHFTVSVFVIRFLFLHVLHARRFRKWITKSK